VTLYMLGKKMFENTDSKTQIRY